MNPNRHVMIGLMLALLGGCGHSKPPLKAVDRIDLERFMGDWYVIANIPTFIERGAHNAVESYRLNADGSIGTTFTFNQGSCSGELKQYHPTGFVRNEGNTIWGMQFLWPIKADYRIIHITPDYGQTVIARNKRDYVWIMARTPAIPDSDYGRILDLVEAAGYDRSRVQKIPQCQSPGAGARS
jgi:apolipoprotein D and lipocalin family protein